MGRMAVASHAILGDVHVPIVFHRVANSLLTTGAAARRELLEWDSGLRCGG